MSRDRLFLDTSYVLARMNQRDQFHAAAEALHPRVRAASEVRTTEAVLIEVGNALSATRREEAVLFIKQCYSTSNVHVEPLSTALLIDSLALYQGRPDKAWGLTDCISFVVMARNELSDQRNFR